MGEMDTASALALYEMAKAHEPLRDAIDAQVLDLHELYSALPFEHALEMAPEGAWIMVKRQPTTAIPSPPFASIWRARTVYYSRTFLGLPFPGQRGSSRRQTQWPMTRARISTPAGELTLLPDEFTIVRKMDEWTRDIGSGVSLHLLGGDVAEADLADRVFYLQSHGLKRWQALSMLLPEVAEPGFAWLSIDGVSDVAEYEAALEAHEPRAAVPA